MAACDYCLQSPHLIGLGDAIADLTGEDDLLDAIAPIIHFETINLDIAWFQSRYDKSTDGGDGKDYINCPMDEAQYDAFIAAMLAAEKMDFREWEANTPYFEGCMPIEVMAERGHDTTFRADETRRLTTPNRSPPHAVVQLRQDNVSARFTTWSASRQDALRPAG